MVSSIIVVGALTHCSLLHIMCDLKAAQMNMQRSLIQKLMLYELKLDHKTAETLKISETRLHESHIHTCELFND